MIFGASGDLTSRKLVPALYDLAREKLLPEKFAVVGFARSDYSPDEFRDRMRAAMEARGEPIDEDIWSWLASRITYRCAGENDEAAYGRLNDHLQEVDAEWNTEGNRLFYLATPPSAYDEILTLMAKSGLSKAPSGCWSRVVVEKPFGRDLASARSLDRKVHRCFDERNVFRIDHYLGKETVQNLFVLRFANGIVEPVWNRRYVDHVQITAAESLGVAHRGAYYEEAGAIRDMLQNHLLQLLALTAMEPPVDFASDAIRDEKTKVLHALQHGGMELIRAQYGAGAIEGQRVPAYRDEEGVDPESNTETFIAARCFIENWRWAGVPFYLRTGKRLPARDTEIIVQFKQPPFLPFEGTAVESLAPNRFVIRIQPDEGVTLQTNAKVPGAGDMMIRDVSMAFEYGESFARETPDAYERLLLDAMLGDATLFTRSDEVMQQWDFVAPFLEEPGPLEFYPAGTWGPTTAHQLIERDGRSWIDPTPAP